MVKMEKENDCKTGEKNNHPINQRELESQNATVLKFLNILGGFSCIFAYV